MSNIVKLQVIPPHEFSPNSLSIPDDFVLESVQKQYAEKFPSNSTKSSAYNLNFGTPTKRTYLDYKMKAIEQTAKAHTCGKTLKEMEDLIWKNLSSIEAVSSEYAIDNPITLFPDDYKHWNLNQFTGNESLIHDVCICFLFYIFYSEPRFTYIIAAYHN